MRHALITSGLLAVTACAGAPESAPDPTDGLDALVASVAFDPEIPGALLYAYSPALSLEWAGAAGVSDLASGTPLSADQTVRNASNTKTYVAAAVLRLWEDGRLELDAPIVSFLDDEQASLLSGDGYELGQISLRHLLSHTGGLIDHGSAPEYLQAVTADPEHRWTRDEQLNGAVAWGDPLGPSGEAYSYSDTGYIILGQVIERVTGEPLGPAVRTLLGFERLGLDATWWELMEDAPASGGSRAHQYLGGTDTHAWDPSLDSYGGGGLVTSSRDLGRFWHALFNGSVFSTSATLDTLLTSPVSPASSDYRMGVFVRDVEGFAGFGHSGFWGTRAVYVPELDLVVAGAVTEQTRAAEVFRMTNEAVRLIVATQNEASGGS
ncbi:MAG: serine hydrolase domain-containing protein [Gemmatimonadota bacterium]